MCIEFYIKRYPDLTREEQEILWKESCNKRTNSVRNAIKTTNIEYYLNLGMSRKEAKKALHDRQCTFSLEKCIAKYGIKKGNEIYGNRQKKWITSLKNHFLEERTSSKPYFQSTLQKEIFESLKESIPELEEEYHIYDDKVAKGFSYDIKYKDKVIEVNGDYWHANPKLYDDKFYNKKLDCCAKDIWNRDKLKKSIARKNNLKLRVIWESDYRENPKRELKKCIDFLKDD